MAPSLLATLQNDIVSSPTLLLLLLFTTFTILSLTYKNYSSSSNSKKALHLPPGPRGLPIIGNLASLDPNLHTHLASLAQTHGPIYKLQLGRKLVIVISSSSLAKQVLKDHDIVFANRDVPDVSQILSYGGNNITWTPYGRKWRLLRKVCVLKMLSNTTLDTFYNLRKQEFRKTVTYLSGRVGAPVKVGEQMFVTVLNVTTNMMWGETVEGEEERERIGRVFKEVIGEMTELLGIPNVADFFPGLGWVDPQGMKRKMKALAKRFDKIFDEMIERKRRRRMEAQDQGGDGNKEKDLLDSLLKLEKEGEEWEEEEDATTTKLSMFNVKALLMDMLLGGTDTASNSIEFAMAEIINSPRVLRKAQEELDVVIGKNKIAEESHITKLPYLHAIMKESLRLHSPLPILVPHCPSENCNVGGYTIPKGTRILVNAWAIQRDPSKWEDPLEFRPERFLDIKLDYSGNDFNYIPFGSGRRICPGISMTERNGMYLLATLLHSFDWKMPEGKKVDLTEKFGIVMKLKTPLEAIPVPRLSCPSLYE